MILLNITELSYSAQLSCALLSGPFHACKLCSCCSSELDYHFGGFETEGTDLVFHCPIASAATAVISPRFCLEWWRGRHRSASNQNKLSPLPPLRPAHLYCVWLQAPVTCGSHSLDVSSAL